MNQAGKGADVNPEDRTGRRKELDEVDQGLNCLGAETVAVADLGEKAGEAKGRDIDCLG